VSLLPEVRWRQLLRWLCGDWSISLWWNWPWRVQIYFWMCEKGNFILLQSKSWRYTGPITQRKSSLQVKWVRAHLPRHERAGSDRQENVHHVSGNERWLPSARWLRPTRLLAKRCDLDQYSAKTEKLQGRRCRSKNERLIDQGKRTLEHRIRRFWYDLRLLAKSSVQ